MEGIQRSPREQKQVYVEKYHALLQEYSSFRTHQAVLQRAIQPRRGRNLSETNSRRNKGDQRNDHIIDSTARLALRTLRSGMMAGFSSPMTPWFRTTSWDPDVALWGQAKAWCSRADEFTYEVLERANAYNTFGYVYENLGLHGVASFGRFSDRDTMVYFDPYAVGTFLFTTDRRGHVASFYHITDMTATQLVSEYGKKNVSSEVYDELYMKHDEVSTVPVLWVVEKNDGRLPGRNDAKNREWKSMRFEMGDAEKSDLILQESGFFACPVAVPRWDVEGTDDWGRSCGMDALPDVNACQVLHEDKLRGIAYRNTPPLGAPKELQHRPSSLLPGHITYYDTGAGMGEVKPLWNVNHSIDDLRQEIMEHDRRIDRAFYADLWQTLAVMEARGEGRQRTATEIAMMHQEKLLMLAPTLFRLVDEMHRPTLEGIRAEGIATGVLEPPPPELKASGLKIDFISILAEAHALVRAGSIERMTDYMGRIAQMSPETLDMVDWDGQARKYADLTNQPDGTMRNELEVEQIRAERQKQMQAARAAEMAAQAAPAAKQLSETQLNTDSALDALMAGTGAAPGAGPPEGV